MVHADLIMKVFDAIPSILWQLGEQIPTQQIQGHFEFGVETLVGKEGCDHSRKLRSVVVYELCKREEVDLVVLLIVDVHPKVLLQDLG